MSYAYVTAAAVMALVLSGCDPSSGEVDAGEAVLDASAPDAEGEPFETDDPRSDGLSGRDWDEEFCESEPGPPAGDRAWWEADRSAIAGDRIFAISPQGLTVIDATVGRSAQVVGRDLSVAAPIEVALLSEHVALVISNASTGSECGVPTLKTRLTTFDVGDPARMQQVAQEELDGVYTGLQRVGDILYVTTISFSSAAVTALNVEEPRVPVRIATRNFSPDNDISDDPVLLATSTRLYAAVQRSNGRIEIDVMPLDGVRGALAIATTLEVQGWLNASWQLNEHDGTLCVLTSSEEQLSPDVLETFAVNEDHQVSPLARIELQHPVAQVLFDGTRAYALSQQTFEPMTGRFRGEWRPIDLRDPSAPRVGEPLELPGFDAVLTPLGDRLLAISQDVAPDGSSDAADILLFDVSDPAAAVQQDERRIVGQPTLEAARGPFGLVAVPLRLAGDGATSCSQASIQLIDLSNDDLALRGPIALSANPERIRWIGDRLLAMTYDGAELVALDDSSVPARVGGIALARYVEQTAPVGDELVLVGTSDQSSRLFLDVQALDAHLPALPNGSLAWAPAECAGGSLRVMQLNVDGSRVHVHYQGLRDRVIERVATIDLSIPGQPRLQSDEELSRASPDEPSGLQYWPVATRPIDHGFVQLDARSESVDDELEGPAARLHVLNSPGSEPPARDELAIEASDEPHTLQTHGDRVYVGRMRAREGAQRVQFFVDRIDLDDPAAPRVAATYNVPGRLLNVLDDDRLLTIGYRRIESEEDNEWSCFDQGGLVRDDLDAETIRCVMFEESLSLIRLEDDAFVLEDRYTLEPGAHVIDGTVRADRVFVVSRSSDSYREVFVLSGLASGRIEAELCVTGERGCAPNESGFVALGYAGVAASDL